MAKSSALPIIAGGAAVGLLIYALSKKGTGGGGQFTASIVATPQSGTSPLNVNLSVQTNGGTAPYTTSWDFGDGTTASGNVQTHLYTNNGTYTVTASVTDSTGLHATDQQVITVNQLPPCGIGFHRDLSGNCVPDTNHIMDVNLTTTSGVAPLNVGFSLTGDVRISDTIVWTFGDGISANGGLQQSHSYGSGTFNGSVKVIYSSDQAVIQKTFTVIVQSNQGGSINLDQINPVIIQGDSAQFSISLSLPWSSIIWAWGDNTANTLNTTNPSHIYNKTGNLNGSVTVTFTNGAQATKTFVTTVNTDTTKTMSVVVQVGPAGTGSITGSQQFFPLEPLLFVAQISGGVSPYLINWDYGDGVTATGQNQTHTYAAGTWIVTATVTDHNNVVASGKLSLSISAPLLQTGDVTMEPRSGSNDGSGLFLSDGGVPIEHISWHGSIVSHRPDEAIQCQIIADILNQDGTINNTIASSYFSVNPLATLLISLSQLNGLSITNNGTVHIRLSLNSTKLPMAGSQLHLDQKTVLV